MRLLTYLLLLSAMISTVSFAEENQQKAKTKQRINRFQRKMRFYKGSKQFLSRAAKLKEGLVKSSEKVKSAKTSGSLSRAKMWEKVTAKRQKTFENYKKYWNKRFKNNFRGVDLEEAIAWYVAMEQMSSLQDTVERIHPPKLTRRESVRNNLRKRFSNLQTAIDAGQEIIELDAQGVSGL